MAKLEKEKCDQLVELCDKYLSGISFYAKLQAAGRFIARRVTTAPTSTKGFAKLSEKNTPTAQSLI